MNKFFIFFLSLVVVTACDPNDVSSETTDDSISGTGAFVFKDYAPLSSKPINVFYHIPANVTASTKILFVFHGAGRNAAEYRDAWIAQANQKGLILVVPEFSENFRKSLNFDDFSNIFF